MMKLKKIDPSTLFFTKVQNDLLIPFYGVTAIWGHDKPACPFAWASSGLNSAVII